MSDNPKGGLEFMGLRFNVIDTRRYLVTNKLVTPSEYFLIQEIELGTIGARNEKRQFCSKAEFRIKDLSDSLGYKTPMKIWKLLKELNLKYIIIREPTRNKATEILGLNPYLFGQILIDTQHELESKRHIKLAVDNTKPNEQEQMNHLDGTNQSFGNNKRIVCDEKTNRLQTVAQVLEITPENPLLDSSRLYLDSSRGNFANAQTKLEEDRTLMPAYLREQWGIQR